MCKCIGGFENCFASAFRVSSWLAMKAANWRPCMALDWRGSFCSVGSSAARTPAAAELSPAWRGAHFTHDLTQIYIKENVM